jgi:hypothetical protein
MVFFINLTNIIKNLICYWLIVWLKEAYKINLIKSSFSFRFCQKNVKRSRQLSTTTIQTTSPTRSGATRKKTTLTFRRFPNFIGSWRSRSKISEDPFFRSWTGVHPETPRGWDSQTASNARHRHRYYYYMIHITRTLFSTCDLYWRLIKHLLCRKNWLFNYAFRSGNLSW